MPETVVKGAQTLTKIEKALKDNYLPVWKNQINTEASALSAKIKKVPLKSDKIVATAPIGLSGGFGFGAEGAATPEAGNVQFERFETRAKDMYVNLCISAKAVRLTGASGSMAGALDTEVKAAYETAKWNVGRALHGDGTGKLATITAQGGNSKSLKVNRTANLKEGLIVDIYSASKEIAYEGVRIVAIDRVGGTVTFDSDVTATSGFITVQNSYMRELTGLGAIFDVDNEIPTIYGVKKADNPYLYPITYNGNGGIYDGLITKALRAAKNEKNSNVDMFLMGDDAYDMYVEYLREHNVRVEDQTHEISGGFKAIKFVFGDRTVDIVNDSFVPADEAWGVDTSALELHTQEWNFADLQGGGIFNLMEGQSIYRALLANYGDLICTNPGGCIRIYGITEMKD